MNLATTKQDRLRVRANARPHPGPLPQERGMRLALSGDVGLGGCSSRLASSLKEAAIATGGQKFHKTGNSFTLSPGERAGVRACNPQDKSLSFTFSSETRTAKADHRIEKRSLVHFGPHKSALVRFSPLNEEKVFSLENVKCDGGDLENKTTTERSVRVGSRWLALAHIVVHPHPSPLPQERGMRSALFGNSETVGCSLRLAASINEGEAETKKLLFHKTRDSFTLSPGERAGVRASVPQTNLFFPEADGVYSRQGMRRTTRLQLTKNCVANALAFPLQLEIPKAQFLDALSLQKKLGSRARRGLVERESRGRSRQAR